MNKIYIKNFKKIINNNRKNYKNGGTHFSNEVPSKHRK